MPSAPSPSLFTIVGGQVTDVQVYEPKTGRYVTQFPNLRMLLKVKASRVIMLRPAAETSPVPVDESKYAHLKTW